MEEITLGAKALVDSLLQKMRVPLSEYTFANLYLFQEVHQFQLVHVDKAQYGVVGLSYEKKRYFLPLYHPSSWEEVRKIARDLGCLYIFPIPEIWWKEMEKFSLTSSDNDSDYLYETEKLKTYSGRHYDGHRHNIKKLLLENHVEEYAYTQDLFPDVEALIRRWEVASADGEETDAESCIKAFKEIDQLQLEGYVFVIDGIFSGCILGGPITDKMYACMFAKAVSPFSGLYQYMYQYFAKQLKEQYLYINFAQDLGIEGLRKAKQSLHPVSMLKKGRLICSEDTAQTMQ